jgi:lysophospholipase L1-like esterase
MADQTPLKWHSPKSAPFHLAGFAWFGAEGIYRRLPSKPAYPLPPAVDSLANSTAGGQIRFQTDSTRLSVKVRLRGLANMNHMPATGQCGFDCYLGPQGRQRYCNTTKYDHKQQSYECLLFTLPPSGMRNVTLNFPLYQGVEEVLVGLDEKAAIAPPPPYQSAGKVVVYGTSITQGGCAARAGMAYTNILSRRIPLEFINLGFSGSGRGEPEVAKVIATIANPALFVLDYEANCVSLELLQKTFPEFIRILREAHPKVPILAVTRIRPASECHDEAPLKARLARRDFQKKTVQALQKKGDRLIFFKDGSNMLGEDFDECTVDGSHPTDLGFVRMADALTPVIRKILS